MIFVDNGERHDPAVNLALEEYALLNIDTHDDILLFYINEPSIIIGRHQNTLEEINREFVEEHGVHVVRRLSGGGAVYHDLGNLNFSFITDARPENFHNFEKFTEPVITTLARIGVAAELSGRNDILVDGRKISGNAQYISKGRMVSHGTLLFNSDLSQIGNALKVSESKITSKGIKSVRSRVANICDFLSEPMTIYEFRRMLSEQIFSTTNSNLRYPLSDQDWQEVEKLANDRYRSWNWNYGYSPDFNIEKCKRFPGGEIDVRLDVQKGLIQSIKFYGDFFSELEPQELEKLLTGVRYDRPDLSQVLEPLEIGRYFAGMDLQTFIEFLF